MTPLVLVSHRTVRPLRTVRAALAVAVLGVCAVVFAGCDAHKAGAIAHDPLVFTIEGASDELYGVEVKVTSEGQPLFEQPVGGDGRVEVPNAPSGEVRVTLRDLRGRYATQSTSVESPGEHELSLVPGTHHRLSVRGDNGAILDSVDMVIWGGAAKPRAFSLSGPKASFGPLPPGAFKLVVSSPGYQTRTLDLNVKPTRQAGKVKDLPDLRLEKGGATLRGRLLVSDRRRPSLRAFLRHGGAGQKIDIASDGSFVLHGLSVASGALEATLVVGDGERELLTRDLRIAADLNVGEISLR